MCASSLPETLLCQLPAAPPATRTPRAAHNAQPRPCCPRSESCPRPKRPRIRSERPASRHGLQRVRRAPAARRALPSGSHRPSEIAQAKSCLGGCRAWLGQVLSRTMAPVRARPRRAPRGNNCLRAPRAPPSGQAGCSQVRLSRFPDMWQSSRSALRRLPPVSRDHGLRLRLKSAASSRLPLESLLPGKP